MLKMMMKPIQVAGLASLMVLAGCGGGGGSASPDAANGQQENSQNNQNNSPVTHAVVTSVLGSGSVTPSSASVTQGGTTSFSITPDSGYQIVSVTGCGGTLSGTTYTTDDISATCTVMATFSPAGNPVLLFSDLISGPDTGLGDGLGSGVIVTVWGQHLGSLQGTSQVEFCDSAAQCRAGHVYYWKNADGVAPSGPANLYESHGMQEIAFSIPDSAIGAGTIRVTVDGDTSTLPFTVRAGEIYHVMPSGDDSNPGTFAEPWLTSGRVGNTSAGGTTAGVGATTYFHGTFSGGISSSSNRGIYFNNSDASSTDANTQFFYVAYPGTHSTTSGQEGFTNYQVSGASISKFKIEASNCTEIANGQRSDCNTNGTWGVRTDQWGRTVGNYFTDQPGRCASRYQGAIVGGASDEDNVSNTKIFGNEIEEYGCYSSNALHHTTYMSIRSAPDDVIVDPWEFGWNYLHDNHTKGGLHQFDQDDGCGDTTGPVIIRNNVIINQAGPGISFASQCGWSMDAYIENNIIINAGRPVEWDGLDPNTGSQNEPGGIVIRDSGVPEESGGLLGTMFIRNNTIQGVGWEGMAEQGEGCIALNGSDANATIELWDNVCVNTRDYPFIGVASRAPEKMSKVSGSNNVFFYAGSGLPTRAVQCVWEDVPVTTNTITSDPLLSITGSRVSVDALSPVLGQSGTDLTRDIYGNLREAFSALGAVENVP